MASGKEVEGGGMTEIQRVLNAQLGVIGKGAIGGDAEKELRGDSSSGDDSSGSRTRIGLLNTRTERDLELAEGDAAQEQVDRTPPSGAAASQEIDDLEDYHDSEAEDPACEWGGDNTAEMKIYRAKREARRAEAKRRQQHHEEGRSRNDEEGGEGDIGEAPMDREMIWGDIDEEDEDEDVRPDHEKEIGRARSASDAVDEHHGGRDRQEKAALERQHSKDAEYPKARSWLEGNTLVIEYIDSRCAEPDVHVVHLSKQEASRLADSGASTESEDASVAHSWLAAHLDELDEHVSDQEHRSWHPAEAAKKLITSGGLQSWLSGKENTKEAKSSKKPNAETDETKQERTDRADMLYAAMNWRGGQHYDEDEKKAKKTPQASRASKRPAAFASTSSEYDESAISANSSTSSLSPTSPGTVPISKGSPRQQQQQGRKASPNTKRRSSSTGRRPSVTGLDGGSAASQLASAPPAPRQHVAYGGRRPSMRRKILAGKVGFGGRGKKPPQDDADESEEELGDIESGPATPTGNGNSTGDKFFPRSSSMGGLNSNAGDVVGVLRSPEELDRERRDSNRTPAASVSFLNTTDTKHDRAARGNTFTGPHGGSASNNSSSSSGMTSEQGSSSGTEDASSSVAPKSSSSAASQQASSSSSKKGTGHRLSAFLSSLGSSSHPHRGDSSAQQGSSGSAIEAFNLQGDAPHPSGTHEQQEEEEEEQDPVAAMFFGSNKSKSKGANGSSKSSSSDAPAARRAMPGPLSRTFIDESQLPSREGTPKEGILSSNTTEGDGADGNGGDGAPSVAFDLPRSRD